MPLTDARLAAQHDLSRVLASARRLDDAAPAILQAISPHLDCVVSELWAIREARHVLESVGTWAANDSYRLFLQTDESFKFARGQGLPGLAWERASPQWMTNVAEDAAFERKLAANACGLRAAVSFPILFGGKVTGVVQFFYAQPRPPDAAMMAIFADIGEQIGLYLERERADAMVVRQAQELAELSAPILRVTDDAILLPVIGTLDARRAIDLTERLLAKVVELGAHVVVIDVTGAATMDTFMAQRILDAVAAIDLLGAETLLTGVRPDAARTLALLGIDFSRLRVCATLADGLASLGKRRRLDGST